MNKLTKDYILAALVRAVRTMAQTALGMITIGAALSDIDWLKVLSVALVSGIYSILTSLATTLPEVGDDGEIVIDDSDPEKTNWLLNVKTDPLDIPTMKSIRLKVTNAENSKKE